MIYVTSDLHGYPIEKVKALFEKANFGEDDFCYILGDVVDRGTDGVELLQWIMRQKNMELLMGNHEAMMYSCGWTCDDLCDVDFDSSDSFLRMRSLLNWQSNGGDTTISGLKLLPSGKRKMIIDYAGERPLYAEVSAGGKDFILTHSGLGRFSPDKKLEEYTPDELLWTRPSLITRYYSDKIVILGHTPTVFYGDEHEGRIMKTETWIDIDAGVACGFAPALMCLDDMTEYYL